MKEDILEEFMKNVRVWPLDRSINSAFYQQDLQDVCRSKQFKLFKFIVDKHLYVSSGSDEVKCIDEIEEKKRITIVKFEKSVL